MDNLFGFLDMLGNYDERRVDRYENDEILVSTVEVTDGDKPFETAIKHPEYGKTGAMIIVEKYDTVEQAQKGHTKWVELVKTDTLPDTLVDCQNAAVSKLINAENLTYTRKKKKEK